MKAGLVLLGLMVTTALRACLWDMDTLAAEAKGKLDFVDATTGRFPRNPPLYYEMRLERVKRELRSTPKKLELYDDAGVANDRLGKGDDAIAWMQKKLVVLNALDMSDPKVKEHWYRYYANLGTFEIHNWFREGQSIERIVEAERARDHIAKAIEINPNAHFGRERVQLHAMEWAISSAKGEESGLHESFGDELDDRTRAGKLAEGLVGLIVLGNAWESPDIFFALAQALSASKQATMGYLAILRCRELVNEGKKLRSSEANDMLNRGSGLMLWMPMENEAELIEKNYANLRAAADDYDQRRNAFAIAKMRQGTHPDTDPEFWSAFTEPRRPEIEPLPWIKQGYNATYVVVGAIIAAIIMLPVVVVLWKRRKRRLAAAG